jgi:hypothetical protein
VKSTQADIERSLREHLPRVFGLSARKDRAAFREKYVAFLDDVERASAAFLSAETLRYQSSVLYASVLFVAVVLFRIGTFKIADTSVAVDLTFLAIYTVFIAMIAALFLMKFLLDRERASISKKKQDEAYRELKEMIEIRGQKTLIQHHFWLAVQNRIRHVFDEQDAAIAALVPSAKQGPPRMDMLEHDPIDLEPLRSDPEFAPEIEKHEAFLVQLDVDIAYDERLFRDAGWSSSKEMTDVATAFDQYLRKWDKALHALLDQSLDVAVGPLDKNPLWTQTMATVDIILASWRVRSKYVWLELIAPMAFAALAILCVWFLWWWTGRFKIGGFI